MAGEEGNALPRYTQPKPSILTTQALHPCSCTLLILHLPLILGGPVLWTLSAK